MLTEREAIAAQICEGFAQAERGELLGSRRGDPDFTRPARESDNCLKDAPCYLLTPRALDDLDDIWNYIAEDNVSAANRVESAILTACGSLASHPLLGSKRSRDHCFAGPILGR